MITFQLADELVAEIDALRGDVPRQQWIARRLTEVVAGEPHWPPSGGDAVWGVRDALADPLSFYVELDRLIAQALGDQQDGL